MFRAQETKMFMATLLGSLRLVRTSSPSQSSPWCGQGGKSRRLLRGFKLAAIHSCRTHMTHSHPDHIPTLSHPSNRQTPAPIHTDKAVEGSPICSLSVHAYAICCRDPCHGSPSADTESAVSTNGWIQITRYVPIYVQHATLFLLNGLGVVVLLYRTCLPLFERCVFPLAQFPCPRQTSCKSI